MCCENPEPKNFSHFSWLFGCAQQTHPRQFSFTLFIVSVSHIEQCVLAFVVVVVFVIARVVSCHKRTCGWQNHLIYVGIESMAQHKRYF